MRYQTISYQQETPKWLWTPFTNGPGDEVDRYNDRITALIAADVLANNAKQLDEDQRREAERLAAEVDLDGL